MSEDAPTSASTTDKSAKRTSRSQATRQVTTEEAEQWAKEEGLLFVEASAKSGTNVQEAFEEACKDILKKVREGVFEDDRVRVCLSPFHVARHMDSDIPMTV